MNFREAWAEGEIEAGALLDEIDRLRAELAAERERCANIVRYWLTGYAPSAGTHEARCVEHILEGRPASAWREKA